MEPVRSGCFCAFILFLAVRLRAADCEKVIVGDPFKIPVSCEPGESGSLMRDVGDDGTLEVATYQSGQWTGSGEYRDRIKIDSSNIVFTHTLYTDGGIYELTCSTIPATKRVQLEVVFAGEKSVTQGDDVTLPCYVKTIGKRGVTGWWEKNGKPLCARNSTPEGCSGSPADRLSVSTDRITAGDLSLTIEGAQPEDGGDYFCYTQDGKQSKPGTPAAVRLTVAGKKLHQMISSSTAAPGNPTQSCVDHTQPWQISTAVLAILLLVALVALIALYFCRRGKISSDSGKLYELVQRSCPASNSNEATTV